jgi:hypothetical protein
VTLARKGTRRITVDGAKYVWKVSVDSGYFTLVVELESGAGQRLEARTQYARHRGDKRSITPAGVAAVIRMAVREGWTPGVKVSPYRMTDIDERVDLSGAASA